MTDPNAVSGAPEVKHQPEVDAEEVEVGGWDYQMASDIAEEIAAKASELSNSIGDEDPEAAVELVDQLAAKLSELRSELVDLYVD